MLATEVDAWLDHRRRTAELIRKPGTLDDLARFTSVEGVLDAVRAG